MSLAISFERATYRNETAVRAILWSSENGRVYIEEIFEAPDYSFVADLAFSRPITHVVTPETREWDAGDELSTREVADILYSQI